MHFPKEYLDELLARVDIVEVVRAFVRLGKVDNQSRYWGLCPFHRERTASFAASSTWQQYHCWGCGAHGAVIRFLMEHAGYQYYGAVMWLAKRYRFYPKEWERKKRRLRQCARK